MSQKKSRGIKTKSFKNKQNSLTSRLLSPISLFLLYNVFLQSKLLKTAFSIRSTAKNRKTQNELLSQCLCANLKSLQHMCLPSKFQNAQRLRFLQCFVLWKFVKCQFQVCPTKTSQVYCQCVMSGVLFCVDDYNNCSKKCWKMLKKLKKLKTPKIIKKTVSFIFSKKYDCSMFYVLNVQCCMLYLFVMSNVCLMATQKYHTYCHHTCLTQKCSF